MVKKNKVVRWFKKHRSTIILYVMLAVVATVFVFLFSLSTSPIYRDHPAYAGVYDGADSLHFQTDGQNWLHGRIPYRDTFDHKGPIIYLINMLGWLIGGESRYGLIPFQIIALTITLIFAWKISQLVKKSPLWGAMSVGLMLLCMIPGYSSGNSVQEYNLPFIMMAMYYMVQYFYAKKLGEHNPWWAFAYGIAIGACLLLQLTHAIPICAGILVIFIVLASQKRWQNLGKNLLYGLAGVLVMWVPFALYFLVNGAFGDFIYCTIIFNFSYAGNIGSWLHGMSSGLIRYFIMTFIPFFCAGIAAALAWTRGKKAYASMLLITFVLEAYLFLSAQCYPQYALPTVFQVLLLLNEIILFEHKEEVKNFAFVGMVGTVVFFAATLLIDRTMTLADQYNTIRKAGQEGIGYERLMEKYLPEIRKTSFTAFGDNPFKGVYVRYKLVSPNKVPLIQNWLSAFTEKVKNEVQADFRENRATYILTDEDFAYDEQYGIGEVLKKYYVKLDSDNNGKYAMYKLKES